MKNHSSIKPPKWINRFIDWACDADFAEEIQGDLFEAFDYRLEKSGPFRAKAMYYLDAIRFMRPIFLKKPTSIQNPNTIMLANYLKIAWRYMTRNKVYTAINLFGLAIGIACAVLIGLYTLDELSYDKFHSKADRIIRIVGDQKDQDGNITETANTYGALMPILQTVFPEWDKVTRFFPNSSLVSVDVEKKFQEDNFFYADSTFLSVFDFPMLDGNPETVLNDPFSMVITEEMALKYFGNTNIIGKVLTVRTDDGVYDFKISGISANVPKSSHIQFDFLASYSSLRKIMPWVNNWHYPPMYTYVLLPENVNLNELQAQLDEIPAKYLREDLAQSRSYTYQKLTEIHLHSQRENELTANGDINYIYIFAAIAAFILLIACINFMNLATANSIDRSKEVGMRKVMGAHRIQLIKQFLSESIIMTVLAMILAGIIVVSILPSFNAFSGKSLEIASFLNWEFLLTGLGFTIGIGVLAGTYPAFYLSRFIPVKVLKGSMTNFGKSSAVWLRKGLVIFQFAISCSLIIGTAVIYSQLNYIQNKKLGFEKERLVLIPLRDEADQVKVEVLRAELIRHPDIISAAASSGIPAKGGYFGFPVTPRNAKADSLILATNFMNDHDYVKTMGMEIIQGRDFSEDFSTDEQAAFIINESAAKKLGWENPVDQEMSLTYHYRGQIKKDGRVIGVVRDFHFNSLRKEVDPVVMHISGGTYYNNNLIVKTSGHNLPQTLVFMEEKWNGFNTARSFEYSFMDEVFGELYKKEENLGKVAGTFSLLAILIACLGLFGLAAFSAERRTREIGIRKVLGASTSHIITLLSIDFLKLVMIAFFLSVPLAYFFMKDWLTGFAYKTNLGIGIFIIAGLISLVIAFLTVSSQAYKAAQTNPGEALRGE